MELKRAERDRQQKGKARLKEEETRQRIKDQDEFRTNMEKERQFTEGIFSSSVLYHCGELINFGRPSLLSRDFSVKSRNRSFKQAVPPVFACDNNNNNLLL